MGHVTCKWVESCHNTPPTLCSVHEVKSTNHVKRVWVMSHINESGVMSKYTSTECSVHDVESNLNSKYSTSFSCIEKARDREGGRDRKKEGERDGVSEGARERGREGTRKCERATEKDRKRERASEKERQGESERFQRAHIYAHTNIRTHVHAHAHAHTHTHARMQRHLSLFLIACTQSNTSK